MGSEEAGGELIAQATEWLVALDTGRADPDLFETWRSADPRHAAAFAQMAAVWERTGALRFSTTRPEPPVTGEVPPQLIRGEDKDGEAGASLHSFMTRRRLLTGGGAAALLAVGTVPLYRSLSGHGVQTSVGERRSIRLPDGSTADLNTNSAIRWRFDAIRAVWLEKGEVALSILEGGTAPFILYSGEVKAHLNAGRYNMRLFDNGPKLTALSGRGEITRSGSDKTALKPMHSISDRDGRIQTAALSFSEMEMISAWRKGEIIFDGMTLEQAVGEFNRYLDKKIIVDDAAVGAIRLGGRFFVDDPSSFLRSLNQGFDIKAEIMPDSIRLHMA